MELGKGNNHAVHHAHLEHQGHNPSHGHMGHDHHKMMIEDFKKRFFISLMVTIPVLVLSEMIQFFFDFHLEFTGDKYVLFILSSLLFFYGGWPVQRSWVLIYPNHKNLITCQGKRWKDFN